MKYTHHLWADAVSNCVWTWDKDYQIMQYSQYLGAPPDSDYAWRWLYSVYRKERLNLSVVFYGGCFFRWYFPKVAIFQCYRTNLAHASLPAQGDEGWVWITVKQGTAFDPFSWVFLQCRKNKERKESLLNLKWWLPMTLQPSRIGLG